MRVAAIPQRALDLVLGRLDLGGARQGRRRLLARGRRSVQESRRRDLGVPPGTDSGARPGDPTSRRGGRPAFQQSPLKVPGRPAWTRRPRTPDDCAAAGCQSNAGPPHPGGNRRPGGAGACERRDRVSYRDLPEGFQRPSRKRHWAERPLRAAAADRLTRRAQVVDDGSDTPGGAGLDRRYPAGTRCRPTALSARAARPRCDRPIGVRRARVHRRWPAARSSRREAETPTRQGQQDPARDHDPRPAALSGSRSEAGYRSGSRVSQPSAKRGPACRLIRCLGFLPRR